MPRGDVPKRFASFSLWSEMSDSLTKCSVLVFEHMKAAVVSRGTFLPFDFFRGRYYNKIVGCY